MNKILHIITSLDRGGAENHLASLAALQAKQKNDVHIIYFRGNNYWVEFLNKKKISIKKFDIKKNFHLINFFLVIFKILIVFFLKDREVKIIFLMEYFLKKSFLKLQSR